MGGALNQPPGFTTAQTQAMLAAVWSRNRDIIMQRLQSIETWLAAASPDPAGNHSRDDARNDAHKLAGSLGMFGLPEGTLLARRIEHALAPDASIDAEDVVALGKAAARLRQLIENHRLELEPAVSPHGHKILVLEGSPDVADSLIREARRRGIQASSASDLAAATRALDEADYNLMVIDLASAELNVHSPDTRADEVRDLIVLHAPMQVVALTSTDTFEDRVTAAQVGAHGFLPKTVPASEILDNCEHLLNLQHAHFKIVAVGNDNASLAPLRALLERHSMRVTPVSDPRLFWETLRETSPDLIILDMDMPDFSGTELCRAVRSDPVYRRVPVLFLSTKIDRDTVTGIYRAGADDFVAKPIIEVELLTRVRNRLERDRLYRSLSDFDPLTGVRNRRSSSVAIANYLRLAERHQLPVSLVVLDLDKFKRVNDSYGHQAGDEVLQYLGGVLKESFRSEDVVARWSGAEFVIAMFAMRRGDGVERLAQVMSRVEEHRFETMDARLFRVTFSAGVAEFPADGTDLHSLYRLADEALYRAKAVGGGRVFPVRTHQKNEPEIAILMRNGDSVAVLRHSLEARGYRVEVFQDADEALSDLTSEAAEPAVRVVLFDEVPAPEIEKIRSALGDASAYLILQAAATEAASSGIECLAKPYKMSTLTQRIRRMIEK